MLETRRDVGFYATPRALTDPGEFGALLDGLPTDMAALRDLVQGLLIHVFWAERYGVSLPEERMAEVQLRGVRAKLRRIVELDSHSLGERRPPDRKLVANCRDFSLMLTAILRHQGVPARARCGFGRYFMPDHFEDHWVCEYWSAAESRWRLVDAQLDELQRDVLGIAFDPLDVPRNSFVSGGRAWQLCRSGEADPDSFGIQDMHGLWFVRGDLIRDVASLAGIETLPWDWWGLVGTPDEALTEDDLALLDRLAAMTADDVPDAPEVRLVGETDSRLRVPDELRS